MKIAFECTAPEELAEASEILTNYFKDDRIFAFFGEMGAGKTTFIKAICAELGSYDSANSPTYGIVNEYLLKNGSKVYHFDFYRITHIEEAIAIGFDEYLNSGNYCFIEWPENVLPLMPERFVKVNILLEEEVRLISMEISV